MVATRRKNHSFGGCAARRSAGMLLCYTRARHEVVGSPGSTDAPERSSLEGLPKKELYYGWVVVWVVFAALLISAGVRAAPTVLINPLEYELGWGRAAISAAVSIGLLLYGLSGPAAGWLMDQIGRAHV